MSGADRPAGRLPVLEDLGDLAGKRVLVRLDLNVPLAEGPDGTVVVADDFRIQAALPTLEYLRAHGATVTIATHLGRPAGEFDARYRVAPVAARLAELGVEATVLENVRFSPGEKKNAPEFVDELVAGQDCYVDDAFGVMHRADASVVGPPARLPSAAGRLVEAEIAAAGPLLGDPPRPFVVVIGGAKVADKLGLLQVLAARADRVLVGGGMAFTFLHALGHPTGASILDRDRLDDCRELIGSSAAILLPVDLVAAPPGVDPRPVRVSGDEAVAEPSKEEASLFGQSIPDGWRGFDIGPATAELYREAIADAAAVLWNGPMGVFEDPRFARGTYEVAKAMAAAPGFTVVGGGDSAAALDRFHITEGIDHISTGGGALLELFEFGDLPGLKALRENLAARVAAGELPAERP